MIEGKLQDFSLPGLLQLLAGESSKSYRLQLRRDGQLGDLLICSGELVVARFGLLDGLDALCELLTWHDGEFGIERVAANYRTTMKENISLKLDQPGSFTDQCNFLRESNVGLNTELVPSATFGTTAWQEALHVHPLRKEDYAVIGWVTDGRTMRHAMREFKFDLITSIGILYRLLITRSVDVVRPTYKPGEGDTTSSDLRRLAEGELAKYGEHEPSGVVEYEAVDVASGSKRPLKATALDTSAAALSSRLAEEDHSDVDSRISITHASPDKELSQVSARLDIDESEQSSKKQAKVRSPRETQDLPALDPDEVEKIKSEPSLVKVEPLPSKSITFAVQVSETSIPSSQSDFDSRRTDPLPLVSIDIERLLNSKFSLTKIGSLALANPDLDDLLRHVLISVERDLSLVIVLTDSNTADGTVLETYKYCMDRGYIEHSDPVMGLTVDLLLEKIDLDQYLLQRRRITGEQLKDLKEISAKQRIPLIRLLVASGYILADDMARLLQEQSRFSR